MKKIILALLCIAMLLSTVACSSNETPATSDTDGGSENPGDGDIIVDVIDPEETPFDENNIVLSFGAIADVHITGSKLETDKFTKALDVLKKRAARNDADGLDAVCISGDIATEGKMEQAELFAQLVKQSGIENVMLTVGNHDVYNGGVSVTTLDVYRKLLGDSYFEVDVDESMFDKGARHCVVKDYHFFFVEPSDFAPPHPYDEEVVQWLDDSIAAIVKENPNAYVFVFTHIPVTDTVQGSWVEDDGAGMGGDGADGLKATLEKYPQVLCFVGHMHRPIIDERSIMQTGFTSVLCGSLRNTVLEPGISDMLGGGDWEASIPKNGHNASIGTLVQVDANGNVRITRLSFARSNQIKEPWEISAPTASGRNLTKYTMARKDENAAPTLTGELTVKVSSGNKLSASLSIPGGQDDDFVRHYLISLIDADGKVVQEEKFITDFYLALQPSNIKSTFSCTITAPAAGEYTLSVVAVDSWDAKSEPVTAQVVFG